MFSFRKKYINPNECRDSENLMIRDPKIEARGKPSTWLPREGLVEHIYRLTKKKFTKATQNENIRKRIKNQTKPSKQRQQT